MKVTKNSVFKSIEHNKLKLYEPVQMVNYKRLPKVPANLELIISRRKRRRQRMILKKKEKETIKYKILYDEISLDRK